MCIALSSSDSSHSDTLYYYKLSVQCFIRNLDSHYWNSCCELLNGLPTFYLLNRLWDFFSYFRLPVFHLKYSIRQMEDHCSNVRYTFIIIINFIFRFFFSVAGKMFISYCVYHLLLILVRSMRSLHFYYMNFLIITA